MVPVGQELVSKPSLSFKACSPTQSDGWYAWVNVIAVRGFGLSFPCIIPIPYVPTYLSKEPLKSTPYLLKITRGETRSAAANFMHVLSLSTLGKHEKPLRHIHLIQFKPQCHLPMSMSMSPSPNPPTFHQPFNL